ncbi:MAG: sulfite exporter TauE/SafE family protein, partial [Bdellovibrionales bacterium]|nr:sulfite exporter TauE/SafE family protein [Bdellovibrionales bacterium]
MANTELLELLKDNPLWSAAIAGLLTTLTPCVYPLIPITLSLFGATSEKSRIRAFILSLSYVLGIASTYTALGIFCAVTGTVFGSFLGNVWIVAGITIFLLILTLYSLEIFELHFLARIQTKAGTVGGRGILGAFLMGSVSGIVAAPCVGPVLLAILAVAANSGDVAWSAILLFTYSLSMGVPFLLLGTFSGLISKLPKAGAWLGVIKFITAVALLMVVQYLAWPFVKRHVDLSFSLSISVISTVFFGGLFLAWIAYRFNLRYLKLIAACAVALCVSPAAITERPSMDLVWNSTLEAALEQGQSRNTVTMVDLYADWCAACKELDHKTFT